MTEESYQQCRKLMRTINHQRGLLTKAKGEVAKWTAIEDGYRRNMKPGQADGAKKKLDKAMDDLRKLRDNFASFKFPDSNLPTPEKDHQHIWYYTLDRKICEICGEMNFDKTQIL